MENRQCFANARSGQLVIFHLYSSLKFSHFHNFTMDPTVPSTSKGNPKETPKDTSKDSIPQKLVSLGLTIIVTCLPGGKRDFHSW